MQTQNSKNIIQIAGIIDEDEARMVLDAGATHLGFPFRLDFNQEDLTEDQASKIIKNLHIQEKSVLITYLDKSDEIIGLADFLGCKTVQLHGPISIQELEKLRNDAPLLGIWKSLVVKKDNADELTQLVTLIENLAAAFITDTFNPETGASGATGKTHDWQVSKQITAVSKKPVIIAGGLNPENVFDAIIQIRPSGVDVHTGVENASGRKDETKVKAFVEEAKRGFLMIR
jgi:phosphoribosylanthranilate isomerase